MLEICPICENPGSLQEHHLVPQEFAGRGVGATAKICATCHLSLHHQAANALGKGAKKNYFTPEALKRAMPLVELIILAELQAEVQGGSKVPKMVSTRLMPDVLIGLHKLKLDSGHKSMETFLESLLTTIVLQKGLIKR